MTMEHSMITAAAKLLQMTEADLARLLESKLSKKAEETWITLKEAAQYAKVTAYTVRRWCNAHHICWRKLNRARCGRIIIEKRSLIEFIEKDCMAQSR